MFVCVRVCARARVRVSQAHRAPVVQIQAPQAGFEGPDPESCCCSHQSPAVTWGPDLPCWGSHCWTPGIQAGTLRGVANELGLPELVFS